MDKDELPKLDAMIRGLKTSICEEGIAQPQLVERCHMLVSQETERHDWIGETTDPFQQVTRLLLAKPRKTLSIEQMAALTGYSQWHFLRRFRQQTGMTPHAFQLACRLRSARSFLRKNVPIAEAAVSAGFSDQSHMHKVFKNHNGLTPRQFQQVSFRLAQK